MRLFSVPEGLELCSHAGVQHGDGDSGNVVAHVVLVHSHLAAALHQRVRRVACRKRKQWGHVMPPPTTGSACFIAKEHERSRELSPASERSCWL